MHNRAPAVAGQFYSADPASLAAEVDAFLDRSLPLQSRPVPLLTLLPHAGYVFCGSVIGATLNRVRLPERLILLGPNHTGQGAPLAVWPDGQWQTPLGAVPVDTELTTTLLDSGTGFTADTRAHTAEHSLEVLLPFLQRAGSTNLRITPVTVSCQPDKLEAAGLALAEVIRAATTVDAATSGVRSIGLIVSSDMNHFADQKATLRLDALALEPFLALDPVRLFNTVSENRISMCGVFPATLGLFACAFLGITPETGTAELVRHTTSADAFGDTNRVVGYAGAYIW